MSTQTGRIIPPAGSIPQPWPWRVWAALLITFAAVLTAHFAFAPPLAISPATLSFLGDSCAVHFRVTNTTGHPTAASLYVILGIGSSGSESAPPSYTEYARKKVSVRLAPKESTSLSSEFAITGRWPPNTARIEIVSTDK